MKLNRVVLFVAIAFGIAHLLFLIFQTSILETLTPYFPLKGDKPLGYFIDLVELVAAEFIWVSIFLLIWWYLMEYTNITSLYGQIEKSLLRNPNRTISTIVAGFVVATVIVAVFTLDEFANSADEYAYLFQAETFSKGKLWYSAHELPDFFQFNHIAQKDGIWISRFPPGWPLVLSVGFLLNIPLFAINLTLGAITLYVFYRFVKTFYDARIAMWSLLSLSFTCFYIFNSASFFSHTSSLLEGLLFIYFFYMYLRRGQRLKHALLAGAFLGLMAINRYYTATLLFLPFFIYCIVKLKGRSFRLLFWIGVGCLPSLAFFFWYNYKITGNALLPVTMWAYHDEALGFINGHSFLRGVNHIFIRFCMFLYWASPAFLALYFFYLWNKIRSKSERLEHPEDYLFLILVVGYTFYYQLGGNQYGPRFYFEALPFLMVFIVAKILKSNQRWALSLLLASLIYCVIKTPFIAAREHKVIEERNDLYAQVRKHNVHHAVVLISSQTSVLRPMSIADLTRNDEQYKNDVLYAIDLDYKNKELIKHYKDRDFYLYQRHSDSSRGKLVKIKEHIVSDTPSRN
jgi:hypothetical protein